MQYKKNNDAKSVETMRDLAIYCCRWGLNLHETGIPAVENAVKDEEVVAAMKKYGLSAPLLIAPYVGEYVSVNAYDSEDIPVCIPFFADMPLTALKGTLLDILEDVVELHAVRLQIDSWEQRVSDLEKIINFKLKF